jgi:Bacteriocin-protection, YdeI or OmpD-Associated/Domain of unknown function (DUF1905)
MSKKPSVTIHFEAHTILIKDQLVILIPEDISLKLPSRGQVSVTGVLNGHEFATVLEPDGRWSHWIRVTDELQELTGLKVGDKVDITLTTTDVWPEPVLPEDIAVALEKAPQKVKDKWQDISPMARWEWVRWVNATGSMETRAVRIVKTISKLDGKHRRPCCFNLAACTVPELSKSGRLLEVE